MNDIEKIDVNILKELFKLLIQLTRDGLTSSSEKRVISLLDQFLYSFSYLALKDCFSPIYRLTINKSIFHSNKRIHEIGLLKYPPANKVTKYGRCNIPGQSVLYACFGKLTALNELKPKRGDLITISKWTAIDNKPIKYCPIFRNQPYEENVKNPRTYAINKIYEESIRDYPINVKEYSDMFLEFVTNAFTKRIERGNHLDYIFSAYFSDKIFRVLENGTFDAIYYPSVQDKLSFENLAIKPESFDSTYKLASVNESVVDMDTSQGGSGYMMYSTSECNNFDLSKDEILWDKSKTIIPKKELNRLISDFDLDLY